jgi:hypothetical protein
MKRSDLKVLFVRSGNRCAFPNCHIELSDSATGGTLIGQIAHIIAQSPSGPRGNGNLSKIERDHHENLLLLCPTHHILVDTKLDIYTVDVLRNMKARHDAWVTDLKKRAQTEQPQSTNHEFLKKIESGWLRFAADERGFRRRLAQMN